MKYLFFLFFFVLTPLISQELAPKNGVKNSTANYYLLKNATILVSPTKTIKNGEILIQNDKIIEVGNSVNTPKDVVIIDYSGKTILPSFIETFSNVSLHSTLSETAHHHSKSSKKGAFYWNESIHPEVEASLLFEINQKANDELIKMGFGLAAVHVQDGIIRGTGSLISLGSSDPNKQMIVPQIASYYSFKTGSSKQSYPSSQMGSIALLRQTFYDFQWYSNTTSQKEQNLSLDALGKQITLPLIFETEDKWEIFRATKIGDEFNYPFVVLGSGTEYAVIDQLKRLKNNLIIPINFPEAYDVKDPYISKEIPLSDLKNWELAPSNPFLLKRNNITFSISSKDQKNAESFWKNIRKAIERGLTVNDALQALTLEPAKLLKVDSDFGTIEKGKKASFTVYDKNPFEEEARVIEAWLLGDQRIFESGNNLDVRGKYNVLIDDKQYPIEISGSLDKLNGKIQTTKQKTDSKTGILSLDTVSNSIFVQLINNDITLQFNVEDINWKGSINLHGQVNTKLGIFEGDGTIPSGKWIKWSAIKNSKSDLSVNDNNKILVDTTSLGKVWFPNMAYGFDSIIGPQTVIIKNATIWTNEKEGILKNATIISENGKITFVGTDSKFNPVGAKIIDAQGKHVTAGIIDEHSHIAISKGVNEGGQSITSEVNIGDVVTSDDINIYRQLSGGVTTAQLLHGSANSIGGQSALIKLKWGKSPDEMLIPNAPKFIKFALGENVKQSNYGDGTRFPQTRMGVEQVFYDGFSRAKVYQNEWKTFKHPSKHNHHLPRKDLELEILAEILNGERFITCHSYIQSEVNMLMHVADSMGFKVNTFTHILEGYKVADKMEKHGVGGSTFADWWAYKYEVKDAIPYNAKLMADQGVVVSINSDDAEMGRRLNQEAAKIVKYGGATEEDAWKMVTLNPAKLLHLDDKIGSLKIGKDADIVIWTANPLSIDAKVELTIIDGEITFDSQRDYLMRIKNQEEKSRIISKMLSSNTKGEELKPFVKKKKKHFHCNTLGEEGSEMENSH
jgi:imidazolonepropionase-like amidohydrolase